ncbi:MAG: metalloregulator ArsR/SmtB family transcription factor [Nanoarchaeota archaeon]|nr:metalloregulator ArsR/SmtB family transcription factor [Nanoarchaeota archaeon]
MNNNTYYLFFTNLANPLKMDIIFCLRDKEKNVSEIIKECGVEQSKVSHALSSLKACNIVQVKQEGKERIYFLNKDTIVPMLKLIEKHANVHCKCKCCDNETCGRRKK